MNNARNNSNRNYRPAPEGLFSEVGNRGGTAQPPILRREMESTRGMMDRMLPSRNNKSAEKDRYIAKLELEVEELKTRCAVHLQKIKELQIEMNRMVVKVSNKKDLRSRYRWNAQDSTYAAAIGKFCKEWLFPRYKFFHNDWMEYSTSRKSLCSMVFKHCPVPAGGDREDQWTRIVAPTMAKKYADMRCNINNDVRKALNSEYYCCMCGSIVLFVATLSNRHLILLLS